MQQDRARKRGIESTGENTTKSYGKSMRTQLKVLHKSAKIDLSHVDLAMKSLSSDKALETYNIAAGALRISVLELRSYDFNGVCDRPARSPATLAVDV